MGLEEELRRKGITFDGGLTSSLESIDPNGHAILRTAELHRSFTNLRDELLENRESQQQFLDERNVPSFPTASIDSDWKVTSTLHPALETRHVEITGPVEIIDKALTTGADNFMLCIEDARARTPESVDNTFVQARYAIDGTNENVQKSKTTITIRPAGLYSDSHMFVDGQVVPATIYDSGMIFSLVAPEQHRRGKPTSLYIPKFETGGGSRFLNTVIHDLIDGHMPVSQVQLSFLIENIMGIINMDDIIEGSKDMIIAANVGRWDYTASILNKFRAHGNMAMPDSDFLTMTTDFMIAYQKRFLYLCHKRGIQPIGGMAAQVPTKDHPDRQKMIDAVKADALREVLMGFYGKWSAHPLTVPIIKEVFMEHMGGNSSQPYKWGHEPMVTVQQLLQVPEGGITYSGLVKDLRIQIEYIAHYRAGKGTFAMDGVSMVDLAIAEIGRNNTTHRLINSVRLDDGRYVDNSLVYNAVGDAISQLKHNYNIERYKKAGFDEKAFGEAANIVIQFIMGRYRNVQYFPRVLDPMLVGKAA